MIAVPPPATFVSMVGQSFDNASDSCRIESSLIMCLQWLAYLVVTS